MVPVVKVVICIYFLISWPIAKCLDYCFGKKHHKSDNLKLENLKTLIELHTSNEITFPAIEKINTGQTKIIHGAINLAKLQLSHYMDSYDSSMIISYDLIINSGTVRKLQSTGYDQLLVHAIDQPRKIIGVFNTKDLCICKMDTSLLQSEVSLGTPIFLQQDSTLFDALNLLEKKGAEWVCVVSNEEELKDIGEDLLESDSPSILGVVSVYYILDILMKDISTEVNIEEQSQIFIKVIQRDSVEDPQIIVTKLEQLNPNDWDKQTDNVANEKISEKPNRKLGLSSDSVFAFV
jgi:CBS domain containing-hemolysin-like protein